MLLIQCAALIARFQKGYRLEKAICIIACFQCNKPGSKSADQPEKDCKEY